MVIVVEYTRANPTDLHWACLTLASTCRCSVNWLNIFFAWASHSACKHTAKSTTHYGPRYHTVVELQGREAAWGLIYFRVQIAMVACKQLGTGLPVIHAITLWLQQQHVQANLATIMCIQAKKNLRSKRPGIRVKPNVHYKSWHCSYSTD